MYKCEVIGMGELCYVDLLLVYVCVCVCVCVGGGGGGGGGDKCVIQRISSIVKP